MPEPISLHDVERRLKKVLVSRMAQHLNPDDIQSDTPLMKKGLALDSVALLEFVVGIEEEFGIFLDDNALSAEHFQTLDTVARFVHGLLTK